MAMDSPSSLTAIISGFPTVLLYQRTVWSLLLAFRNRIRALFLLLTLSYHRGLNKIVVKSHPRSKQHGRPGCSRGKGQNPFLAVEQ